MYEALNFRFTVVWMSINDISSKDIEQIVEQTENTQCVCNVHFRAVGRMREREGRGGWAEPVSQSTNLQIFVQSEGTLCTI